MLTRKLAVIAQQRLITSKPTSTKLQPFIQPPLDFAKLQKFQSYDVIPKGLLINYIKEKKQGVDIDKLANLNIHEFDLIACYHLFKSVPTIGRFECPELKPILHLMLSKFDSDSNQSKLDELAEYIYDKCISIFPLTYIPLLNNLKLNKNYRLWISFFLYEIIWDFSL
jgi:hypothetical protein